MLSQLVTFIKGTGLSFDKLMHEVFSRVKIIITVHHRENCFRADISKKKDLPWPKKEF